MPFKNPPSTIVLPAGATSGSRIVLDGKLGNIRIYGANGSIITLDPNAQFPIISFTSRDGTNTAFINITGAGAGDADLGISGGTFTPADGVLRRFRLVMQGTTDQAQFQTVNANTQAIFGGYTAITSTYAEIGYRNTVSTRRIYIDDDLGTGRILLSPGEYVDVLSGALRVNGRDMGKGHLWTVGATFASATSGGEQIIETGLSTVFEAGRAYKFEWRGLISAGSGVGVGKGIWQLRDNNLAGTSRCYEFATVYGAGNTRGNVGYYGQQILYNNTGSNITRVMCLTLQPSDTAGGTLFANAAAEIKRFFRCTDVGLASEYLLEGFNF